MKRIYLCKYDSEFYIFTHHVNCNGKPLTGRALNLKLKDLGYIFMGRL